MYNKNMANLTIRADTLPRCIPIFPGKYWKTFASRAFEFDLYTSRTTAFLVMNQSPLGR